MRSLCADMEVLYWKHVREQLETLRKLQRREVAEPWLPRAEEGLWPAEEDHLEAADDFLEPEEYEEPEGAELGEAADLGRSGNGPRLRLGEGCGPQLTATPRCPFQKQRPCQYP